MKTPLIWLLPLLLIFAGCSDDDLPPTYHQKRMNLTDHEWKVGLLTLKDGVDQSADFQSLTFDFADDNSVVARAINGQTFYGTWGYSALETGSEQFNIQFTGSDMLSRLNNSWIVERFSTTRLEAKTMPQGTEEEVSRLHLDRL